MSQSQETNALTTALKAYLEEVIKSDNELMQKIDFSESRLKEMTDYVTKQAKAYLNGKNGAIPDATVYKWSRDYFIDYEEIKKAEEEKRLKDEKEKAEREQKWKEEREKREKEREEFEKLSDEEKEEVLREREEQRKIKEWEEKQKKKEEKERKEWEEKERKEKEMGVQYLF